ncbi:prepilin-type N-terminal cleavage/methylation domain-containing protein [Parelusimicrobium proximum]|uniref:type IV pilin protein n=1 Tax=Parelusimicrobium proximum TaxID=3228953 RepID=UPI003D16AAFF
MKRGFTLIELLVVVLIIAILAAVALPQYTAAVEKSRATEAFLNLKAIQGAEQRYYLMNDSYTSNFSELDITPPGTLNGARMETSSFSIVLIPSHKYASSQRLPLNTKYALLMSFETGETHCYAHADAYKKVCESLGGTPVSVQLDGTACPYTECYKLP